MKPTANRTIARFNSDRSQAVIIDALESRRLLDGLTGQYFNRKDFTELVTTRLDPTLDFTWSGAPTAGVNADHFSVRWTGQVEAPTSEVYTFTTTADDGVRLWVDGRLLIDNWVNQSSTDRSASVALEAGKRYDIRLDYYEFDQGARLRLSWSTPTTSRVTIPANRLFESPQGLSATYFDDVDFTTPVMQRVDSTVNFNWPTGLPAPSMDGNGFAIRWNGYVVPEYTQTYTFRVNTDPSNTVRLRVNGELLSHNTSVQDDGRIRLEAGVRYPISLEFADASSSASVQLVWQSPSRAMQIVPADRLFVGEATSLPSRRTTYTNPVFNADRPDPGIIRADGAYWMIHTTGGPDYGWPLYRSLDGVSWTYLRQLLTPANKLSWMNGNYWAPEIHKVGNQFILTGTSLDSRTGRMTIVMASSPTIDGTYTVRANPIVTDSRHVLDSNIFIDDNGTPYLLWKRDGPSGGTFGSIRIRQLDPTGLNFAAGSSEVTLLDNNTGGWERNLAEAPWLVKRADAYYLFYSGGFIDTTYSLGVARGTSLTSAFTRNPANPIIGNNSTWVGPGHGGFSTDLDGTLWHLYHARKSADPNFGRVQVLDPVVWLPSGWPTFVGGGVSTTPKPGPRVQAVTGANNITIHGNASGVDNVRIVRGADVSSLDVYINDVLNRTFTYAETQQLIINAGGGDDVVVLDFSRGNIIPGSGLRIDAGTGNDTVRIVGTSADTFRHLGNGHIANGSGLLTLIGVETTQLDGGAHQIKSDLGLMNLDVLSGDVLFEAPTTRLGAFTIAAEARAALATGDRTLSVTGFALSATGRLDLADGAFVIDYSASDASPLPTIEDHVRTGRNGGTWDANTGIVSSVAAMLSGRGIGVAEASDALPTTPAVFANVNVDASAILLRYTLAADINLDRSVNFDDLLTLAQNYGSAGRSFGQGNIDWSADGLVSFDDLLLLAQSYGTILPLPAALVTSTTDPIPNGKAAAATKRKDSPTADLLA